MENLTASTLHINHDTVYACRSVLWASWRRSSARCWDVTDRVHRLENELRRQTELLGQVEHPISHRS